MQDSSPHSESHYRDTFAESLAHRYRRQLELGRHPVMEDYLQGYPEPIRSQLFLRLFEVDVQYRKSIGQPVSLAEFVSRFPEYRDLIATAVGNESLTVPNQQGPETVNYLRPALGRFSRFQLLEEIGQGGHGTVYRARDLELDRMVAIKFPRTDRFTVEQRQRFLREARAAAQLRDPYIASVYDVIETDQTIGLVSNFISGVSLGEWLRHQRMAIADAIPILVMLARTLQLAHDAGIVHRDLKPENVLLDIEGRPHITDFGLAKRLGVDEDLTLDGQVIGTLSYMAPEQAGGRITEHDFRSDTYALGIMLYEMLTGQRPFVGPLKSVLYQIQHIDPRPVRAWNSEVPQALETLCHKAIAKSAADRYQTAAEFADDLERYRDGMAIQAKRPSLLHRSLCTAGRHPRTTAVTVLLASLAGLLAWTVPPKRNEQTERNTSTLAASVTGPLTGWSGEITDIPFAKGKPFSLLTVKPQPLIFASESEESFYSFPDDRGRFVVKSPLISVFVWPVTQPRNFRWGVNVSMSEDFDQGGLCWNIRQAKSETGFPGFAANAVTWRNEPRNRVWQIAFETLFLEGLPPNQVVIQSRQTGKWKPISYDDVQSDAVQIRVENGSLRDLVMFGNSVEFVHDFADKGLLHRCSLGFMAGSGKLTFTDALISEDLK